MFDFEGKTVLITGASYGLGEVFAKRFAEDGADLLLTARSTDLLEAVAASCREQGSKVTTVTGDVSVEDDVNRVIAAGIEGHGRIDVLVNNAGISDLQGVVAEWYDTERFKQILAVDLIGAFLYMREVGRHMLQTGGGSIVNIASYLAENGSEMDIIAYTAAKGGLVNLGRQLGYEWADRGVRVNTVSPGYIMTEMIRPAVEGTPVEAYIQSRTPMRRLGEADEVANTVMFLASDASGYITGVNLPVDGGSSAGMGAHQIKPIHYDWNADTFPQVPGGYDGLVPRPEDYQAMAAGIPGIHYELPTE